MPDTPRFLITSADERTWKFDRPVIFLGQWCKSYNRKQVWQNMDAITLPPLGYGQEQKDLLYAQARLYEEQLFSILTKALNDYHGFEHDSRFWKIVAGPWLRRNVDVIFNRIHTLDYCAKNYKLSGVASLGTGIELATNDALSALSSYGDDRWNNAIFVRILHLLNIENCHVETVSQGNFEAVSSVNAVPVRPMMNRLLKLAGESFGRVTRFFARETDAFIIHTYLPKLKQILLQLAIGQVPQFWVIPKLYLANTVNHTLRQVLINKYVNQIDSPMVRMAATLMFETLPICYLEGFAELRKTVNDLPFPAKPRLIFTSNNFEANEVFQLWAATKVESGSRYIVGQHGNNYGTYRYMRHTIEEETSDKFLTWGWADGLPQHTPAFIFKMAGSNVFPKYNPDGGLLLVENILGHRIYVWDRPYDFEFYLEEQMKFAGGLADNPKSKLTVRLHYTNTYFNACELERWYDFDPRIKVEGGLTPFANLISQSRLVVYGYDSTGILESLALNMPILVLMENKFEFLREGAKPYYQLLLDAGIVHLSAESASNKVNEIWDDVAGWWATKQVQEARLSFCSQYSRVSHHPVADLKKILN